MVADARQEAVLSMDGASVRLSEGRFYTEMLSLVGVMRDPTEQPVVTLIPTRNFQRHHEVATEKYAAVLEALRTQGNIEVRMWETKLHKYRSNKFDKSSLLFC